MYPNQSLHDTYPIVSSSNVTSLHSCWIFQLSCPFTGRYHIIGVRVITPPWAPLTLHGTRPPCCQTRKDATAATPRAANRGKPPNLQLGSGHLKLTMLDSSPTYSNFSFVSKSHIATCFYFGNMYRFRNPVTGGSNPFIT